MKRDDVRLGFSALRVRAGYSVEEFAEVLGYDCPSAVTRYEHRGGSYQHTHLPQDLIERMIENLVGEGLPTITREDILQLSAEQDTTPRDPMAELVTPSLLADILVAFDLAIENAARLKSMAEVSTKARHTATLFKQLTSGAIGAPMVEEIMGQVLHAQTGPLLGEAEREAILQELLARAMLVELIEHSVQASSTAAFLGHLLKTRYQGIPLQRQKSKDLCSILDEVRAIAAAHEDTTVDDSQNVVMLSTFRK